MDQKYKKLKQLDMILNLLCETLTSSATFHTPEVTKQS